MTTINLNAVSAVILAGGKSRRMNNTDKLALTFGDTSLLAWSIELIRPQVGQIMLNSNTDHSHIVGALPCIGDVEKGEAGPLDGIVSVMEWLHLHQPDCQWLLSAPADCPFLPGDLLQRLIAGAAQKPGVKVVVPSSANKKHYTCSLWATELRNEGRIFLNRGGRALRHFIGGLPNTEVGFPIKKIDPFFNVNTPEDYRRALELATAKT